MSPISADEAYALTNPGDSEEARTQAAQNIMAGVAANDAYLNSRSELEQIVARARGGQVPPSHADLNAAEEGTPGTDLAAKAPAPGVTDTTATEIAAAPAPAVPTPTAEMTSEERAAEIDALQHRLAELEGGH